MKEANRFLVLMIGCSVFACGIEEPDVAKAQFADGSVMAVDTMVVNSVDGSLPQATAQKPQCTMQLGMPDTIETVVERGTYLMIRVKVMFWDASVGPLDVRLVPAVGQAIHPRSISWITKDKAEIDFGRYDFLGDQKEFSFTAKTTNAPCLPAYFNVKVIP